jgi:quinol monooxygenase YgiN
VSALYLIAEIYPRNEKVEQARSEFDQLVAKTRAEEGCLLYDLVQEDGSNGWLMIEKWQSRAHWEDHIETDHVKHINSLDDLFERPTNLRFMTEVEV